MKGLKGLASFMVLLSLTVCVPRASAEIKQQQNKFPAESQIRPNQSVGDNQNTNNRLEEGFSLLKAEKYREAINIFSQVIQSEPNNQYAYLGRGTSYYSLNDYQKAKADLDKCIGIDSSIAFAYTLRGLSNYELGRKQEAISDLEAAANLFKKQGETELAQKALDAVQRIRNT